jgi:hypothetical protein
MYKEIFWEREGLFPYCIVAFNSKRNFEWRWINANTFHLFHSMIDKGNLAILHAQSNDPDIRWIAGVLLKNNPMIDKRLYDINLWDKMETTYNIKNAGAGRVNLDGTGTRFLDQSGRYGLVQEPVILPLLSMLL